MMKKEVAEKKEGVAQALWGGHKLHCQHCKSVDIAKPATFARCCFDGAILLKDCLAEISAPAIAAKKRAERARNRDENHVSAKKLAGEMRYVQ